MFFFVRRLKYLNLAKNNNKSGWSFQIFLYFHPYLRKIPNLTNIFSDGLVQPPTSYKSLLKFLTKKRVLLFPNLRVSGPDGSDLPGDLAMFASCSRPQRSHSNLPTSKCRGVFMAVEDDVFYVFSSFFWMSQRNCEVYVYIYIYIYIYIIIYHICMLYTYMHYSMGCLPSH